MELSNNFIGENLLNDCIREYYAKNGNQPNEKFDANTSDDGFFVCYLINRKHAIKYEFFFDRNLFIGSLTLAIGPHYFGSSAFWSYENSTRFSINATTEAVEKNLALLDEFWGIHSE